MITQVARSSGGAGAHRRRGVAALVAGLGWLTLASPLAAQDARAQPKATETLRDGFEGPTKVWRQEQPDAAIEIFLHDRTNRAAHEGTRSEGFEFKAGLGGGLYYSYALPPVPVTDDLTVTMFVRSNRTGVQLLARVVLPSDIDPDSQKPSFVLIPSSTYEAADRWQKIELGDMMPAIERQARVLRASSRRKVSLEGAYVERLIVNIYGGEGVTDVYLDELSIGPVSAEVADSYARLLRGEPIGRRGGRAATVGPAARTIADRPRSPTEPLEPLPPGAAARIKFDRNRLLKDGYPWFPTMIRAFDADPTTIRRLGSDVAVVPVDANPDYLETAIKSGLFLMPELGGDSDSDPDPDTKPRPVEPDAIIASAASFPRKEHVFAWSVGSNLGEERDLADRRLTARKIREAILDIRRTKPGGSPFTTGTVLGMLPEYARAPENLDMIGIPASTWGTVQGPFENYRYLEQRRNLTARSNDELLWAEVDVTAPTIYKRMIWGMDRPPAWGVPRIQPEQIRTATFAALAAGCRGICFRAEGDLSQGPGRMATIEMAILNEEIDLLEPILADPDRSIRLVDTYQPDPTPPPPATFLQMNTSVANRTPTVKELPPFAHIKAATISTKDRRGVLMMVSEFTQYSQYQPPQMAMNKLKLRIKAAADAIPYLISPGGVRPLNSIRVPGGHDITLDDFGGTAIVLMTTNVDLKNQIEQAVNNVRPFAISLAIEQAELQRAWVVEVDYQLQRDGHAQKDSVELIAKADELIKSARDALEREDYPTAWEEARRVGRPLRILMRYHFMAAYDAIIKALKDEDLPCGPIIYEGMKKPQDRLIAPMVVAPLASFNTLPQAWQWLEWIKRGRLGPNAVPSGDFSFKSKADFLDSGWTSVPYATDDLVATLAIIPGGPDNVKADKDKGTDLAVSVKPRPGLRLDATIPFADHPIVAVRSPAVPVRAGEMYRVSCMVYMSNNAPPGAGGLIIRDNFGGERLQYRTAGALANWFEVVYYRRIPTDGELSVTLGMAAVTGDAAFDDFKIEPIVEQINLENRPVTVRARRATDTAATANPDGTPATAPKAEARPNRAAFRPLAVPIRE